MTFQAYIDNIKAKTGKTPEEFKKLAKEKGLPEPGAKGGAIVAWLKEDFGLGHGPCRGDLQHVQGADEVAELGNYLRDTSRIN